MAFADDNNDDLGETLFRVGSWVEIGASLTQLPELVAEDRLVLMFEYSIPINEEIFWECFVLAQSLSKRKPRFEYRAELDHHLFTGLLNAKISWPMSEVSVNARHYAGYT